LPSLTKISGIKIECFSADHPPPHVHAKYGEYEDLIIINSGEIHVGDLPRKQRKIAIEYVNKNRDLISIIFNLLNPQIKRNAKK